jgi:hypothetical protein
MGMVGPDVNRVSNSSEGDWWMLVREAKGKDSSKTSVERPICSWRRDRGTETPYTQRSSQRRQIEIEAPVPLIL